MVTHSFTWIAVSQNVTHILCHEPWVTLSVHDVDVVASGLRDLRINMYNPDSLISM